MNRLLFVVVLSLTMAASASELSVSTRHDVLVTEDTKQLLRVVFVDAELIVDASLDVYVLEQLPSTRAHYAELRQLDERNWLDAVSWILTYADGREATLPHPVVLSKTVRQRGPDASREVDRDVSVPMSSYRARLAFGALSPGDYVLKASLRGLTSSFSLAVRTGDEPGLRDHYLRLKAMRTQDYAAFRSLQLQRFERNPARVDALYDLIDRALVQGTLLETRSYFERVIAAAEEAMLGIRDPDDRARARRGVAQLRAVRETLPEYYRNRSSWELSRNMKDGHYSIRDRRSGLVIRDFAER